MDDMENKLGAILGNPEMMQKIMTLAQSFEKPAGEAPPQKETPAEVVSSPGMPEIDMGMLKKLSGFMSGSAIDKNQQRLLRALTPYISNVRIRKLERAMQAARMASMAGGLFGGGQFPFGR